MAKFQATFRDFYMSSSWQALLVVLIACAVGMGIGYASLTKAVATACSTYSAQAGSPEGYAPPFNIFNDAKELLVKATCDGNNIFIEAGENISGMYVYKYGYAWQNNAWRQFTYTGTPVATNSIWLNGLATSNLSRTDAEMLRTNYFVAYTCQFLDNMWKCGCKDQACAQAAWQIQGFTKPKEVADVWKGYEGLMVSSASKFAAPPGSTISLMGAGFSTVDNTILFGARKIPNIKAANPNMISFTIPSDVVPGLVTVGVENDKGKTATGTQIMVTKPGALPPVVSSMTPTKGGFDTVVTIRGANFSPTNNYVLGSHGMISKLNSPDGKTLSFHVRPFPDNPIWEGATTTKASGTTFDLHFHVLNTGGISTKSVIFTIQIP